MSRFGSFPKSDLTIVAPDGTVRATTRGMVPGGTIFIEDTSVVIQVGDEIRRELPSGVEEVFRVDDPRYYPKVHSLPEHYQVKVSRKGAYPRHTGGHYINVSGHNARVNINSVDQSSNVVNDRSVFKDLLTAIERDIPAEEDRATLQDAVTHMERAPDREGFKAAYKEFVSLAADHMTIVAPFLPALSMLL